VWIVIGVVVLFGCGTAYAAPKVKDYLAVNSAIGGAKQLQASGNYADALAKLNGVDGMWMLSSIRQNLESLEKQESGFVQDQNNYNLAVSEESSSTSNAQSLLQSIPTDYPQYDQVQIALNSVQSQIEGQLKDEAQQAEVQAKQSQAQAQSAQAAKVQAEADATAAANAKAAAEAQAAALAEQEQQAAAEAQQAKEAQQQQAQQQAAQMRQTAINSLSSIFNTFKNDGMADYNEGISYYNEGDDSEALTYFSEAEATFKSIGGSLTQLGDSYTNLDSDIFNAIATLQQGALSCMQANLSVVETIGGTSSDAVTNSYSSSCTSDENIVGAFLNSQ
jgi:flagellar biosynthesis GTPase FlhF